MGEADLRANALARSSAAAARDAIINDEAKRQVALKVEAELNGFTTEEKTRWLECLEEHGNVHRACQAVGISRRSANTARQRDALFADAWHEILEAKVDNVAQVLYEQCMDPSSANTVARIFYLKSMRREKYGDTVSVETKHKVNVIVELVPPRDAPEMLTAAASASADVVDAEVVED